MCVFQRKHLGFSSGHLGVLTVCIQLSPSLTLSRIGSSLVTTVRVSLGPGAGHHLPQCACPGKSSSLHQRFPDPLPRIHSGSLEARRLGYGMLQLLQSLATILTLSERAGHWISRQRVMAATLRQLSFLLCYCSLPLSPCRG